MKSVRWGIIGCGDVTEVKSGPGFQQAADSALIAVMRRNGDLARQYAERHGVERWYADADQLINDPDVNAVYIATPPGSHLEYALKVCAAGKPAYVEKPMARNFAECKIMVEAFRQAHIPLFVAYYRRALDRFIKARELIAAGAIGRVTGIDYRFSTVLAPSHSGDAMPWPLTLPPAASPQQSRLPWRLRAEEAGGGLFLDLGCHTLDIIAFIVGGIGDATGFAANCGHQYAVEDTVALSFLTRNGTPGTARWNFAADRREDLIEITGTKGRIALSTFGNEPVRLENAEACKTFDLPNPKHIQAPMIQAIVNDLLGRGACPSTGDSAAETNRIMDAALGGYYGGRSDAFWLRQETWPGIQVT